MILSLAKLRKSAEQKPVGYLEDVISAGTVNGDSLTLSTEAYIKLSAKYSPGRKSMVLQTKETEFLIAEDQRKLAAFFNDDYVCDFPGCAELKQSYEKEVAILGKNCPQCQLIALRQKYLHAVEQVKYPHERPMPRAN